MLLCGCLRKKNKSDKGVKRSDGDNNKKTRLRGARAAVSLLMSSDGGGHCPVLMSLPLFTTQQEDEEDKLINHSVAADFN